jgi:hypothetical protein
MESAVPIPQGATLQPIGGAGGGVPIPQGAKLQPIGSSGAGGSWDDDRSFLEKNAWGPMAQAGQARQADADKTPGMGGISGMAQRSLGYLQGEGAGVGRALEGAATSIPGFVKGMVTHPGDTALDLGRSVTGVLGNLGKLETYTDPSKMGSEVTNLAMLERGAEGAATSIPGFVNAARLIPDVFKEGLDGALKTNALARAANYAQGIKEYFKKGEAQMANSVQDSVRSIQIADEMKSRAAGVKGAIDGTQAHAAADEALGKVGIQAGTAAGKAIQLLSTATKDMTFEEAKQMRSKLGQLSAATKSSVDRLVVNEGRAALTDALQKRAGEIGQTSQFKSYNQVWKMLSDAKDNWLQDLYESHSPYSIHNIMTGENGGLISKAAREMSEKFDTDHDAFKQNLDGLKKNIAWVPLEKGGMNFRGVLGTIGKHPVTGLAAYSAAQALGLPFLARFLAVFGAGRVADILDQAGQPRASLPDVWGDAPKQSGIIPPGSGTVNTQPQQPPPMVQAPITPNSPEIAHAMETLGSPADLKNVSPQEMPPAVGTAKPIERRIAGGEGPGGSERRMRPIGTVPAGGSAVENVLKAKLAKDPGNEVLKAQLADIQAHPPEINEGQTLAEQIRQTRALSGKQTSGSGKAEGKAQAENIQAAKQSTFAAHQRSKGGSNVLHPDEVLGPTVPSSELNEISKAILNVDDYNSLSKEQKGLIMDIAHSTKPRSMSSGKRKP